jgi:3-oxoacyl-(acyl-carrier-protein) synthase/NAD(P)-dependent dehydrogenase (short-subunit alcohol dehydrogenase family)
LQALQSSSYGEADLARIAYTLQVGREAMEQRLAFTAATMSELQRKLADYVEGKIERGEIDACYRGDVKKNKEMLSLFNADDALQHAIATWVEQGKYAKLLDLWTKGLMFDWNQLYATNKPLRISLPTYPFAKERYWISNAATSVASEGSLLPLSVAAGVSVTPDEIIERVERVMIKGWRASVAISAEGSPLRNVVIVATQETRTLADGLAARLMDSRVLILDGEPADVSTEVDWQSVAGWIDIVGCGSSRSHAAEWLVKLQQWVECGPKNGLVGLCVTRGLEAYENVTMNLSGADRVGLYRMLSSEYARVRSRHVDVDSGSDDATLIEQVIAECAAHSDEVEVCYRQGVRYQAVLEEKPLGTGVALLDEQPGWVFPSEQVLWITGGTRGIGYLCAQHFVRRHGVKRLVLTGREEFPPREQWQQAQLESTPLAQKIRAMLALESEGAEVRVLSVSLTDEASLQESVQAVKETLGPIAGVIHCAGMVDIENPAFVRKTLAGMQAVLAPKVQGLDHLVNCVAAEPLQFFVLFSSVSATVPGLAVGQSDYAMANAYMDYVAQAYAATLPMLSIQWPSWKEVGMGESRSSVYRQLGFLSHTNAEGLSFLDYLLMHKNGAVVLPAIVNTASWQPANLLQLFSKAGAGSKSGSVTRSLQEFKVSDSSLSAIQSWVMDVFAQELKMDVSRIEIDTPLPDYGVDSILLVQVLRPISERVGELIDPSILFEHQTIATFSQWLARSYGDVLAVEAEHSSSQAFVENPEISPVTANSIVPTLVYQSPVPTADIAVVGLSCRFAGANNIEEYWHLLSEGRSAIRRVPSQRWGHESRYHAGVLDNATQFDPAFFLISQADARAMDPQALLVLEESLAVWYQAGYSLQEIKGRAMGVYLGGRSQHAPDAVTLAAAHNPIMAVGANYLAANISRFFDLRGPSVVIDTACSSALVAMSMAIQSIRSGEIESALVGGVNLLSNDGALRMFEQRGILNREPVFHLLDRRASGTILGEGVGMVWLKTVDQAVRDGDSIYAVIKALAINNDGHTAGPAAPNLQAQKDVMQAALVRSGKRAEEISYIDVNGSGTEVMDLLELKAIESVYRPSSKTPCELGSMKPNIGHPLCAEGIASFIKSILMLHHRQRVPFLSAQEPMRHYDIASSPFRFSRALSAVGDAPTVVAINCFADGGTNAHVILESWREQEPREVAHRPVAPPILRKIELRSSRSEPDPVSGATSKQFKRSDHSYDNAEQQTELPPSRFWEQHMSLDIVEEL